MGTSATNCFSRNIRRDLPEHGVCVCVFLSIMRRYLGWCSGLAPGVCVVSRLRRYRTPILLIPLCGGDQINTHQHPSRPAYRILMYQGFVSISHSEEFHVLLPIKQGLSNMVDLYGRGKSGVTLTPQVDADSHQKSSVPITSLDDLRGKSVNSLMN